MIMYSIVFTEQELLILERIMSDQVHNNFSVWSYMAEMSDFVTEELKKQWHLLWELDDISKKIAAPFGLSKRAD